MGAGHGHSRGVQQTLIQQSKALFFGVVGDGEDGQLFQTICEGKKDDGGRDVEGGVDHSNAPGGDGLVHKIKVDHGVQTVETAQKDRDADDVEVEVDHGGTAGILICAHRRNQRGDTGADILTHDDGDSAAVGDDAGICDEAFFKKMKNTALFVNVGRGPIVDTDALINALKTGEIDYAALDVTDPEPLPADHPLLDVENCLIVPHIGSYTDRTRYDMSILTADNHQWISDRKSVV